uniref:TonB-dependent receptor plug domain-containing protein n=1 Tax=Tenacibaculum sp. Pbs-1 TaxID=3238748 RepID=A0AB33KWC8_9FLAO
MSIFSQEKVDISFIDAPLLNVLKETEALFKVKFSFSTEVINDKNISFKKKKCELVYLINEIQRQTSLIFNKINERYYYITINSTFKSNEYNLLKEVLVTNYITSGINKKRNGTISIIPKQLGVLPGLTEPDILESLKIIPGVQSPNETAAGIYIRGGTPNQNLVLWDGIKMYYSGHFFGMISAFNPYTTKEINLSKSGTGARYGNRVSGVIDIKTTNKIPKKITGSFGLNMTHADALLTIPFSKKTAFSISARRSFSDVLKTFTFDKLSMRVFQTFDDNQESQIIDKNIKFSRDNKFNFSDYTTKFIYTPSKDESLNISFLYTNNQMLNNFVIPRYKDKYNDELEIHNTGVSVNWNKQSSEKKTHNIKSYFSNFKLKYKGNYNYIDDYLILLSTKNNSLTDFGLSYNMNYSFNDKTDLFWGYDFTSTKAAYELKYLIDLEGNRNSSIQKDKVTNNTHSIFTEYIYDNNNWNINSGIRLNYFSKSINLFLNLDYIWRKNLHQA